MWLWCLSWHVSHDKFYQAFFPLFVLQVTNAGGMEAWEQGYSSDPLWQLISIYTYVFVKFCTVCLFKFGKGYWAHQVAYIHLFWRYINHAMHFNSFVQWYMYPVWKFTCTCVTKSVCSASLLFALTKGCPRSLQYQDRSTKNAHHYWVTSSLTSSKTRNWRHLAWGWWEFLRTAR